MPVALDADALNLIARDAALLAAAQARSAPTLATPHPGEAARVLGIDIRPSRATACGAARELAQRLPHTSCSRARAACSRIRTAPGTSTPAAGPRSPPRAAATCCAGLLGALLAQRSTAKAALRYAVCLHGAAADALVARGDGPLGVTASELPDAARALVNRARRA